MFPHTLSSRPLVVCSDSIICLKFISLEKELKISCDNQSIMKISTEELVYIRRSNYNLSLVHPKGYNYFNILTSKLNWSR